MKSKLFDNLSGGTNHDNKNKSHAPKRQGTFKVMYQFDSEEPKQLFDEINLENDFIITLRAPSEHEDIANYLEFSSKDGHKLKLYGIKITK